MAEQEPSNPVKAPSGFTSIGNELDPTAPLWRVYRDEVRSHDQNVTFDEWNKTLDILLIFAGLFSAVVTSFLVASYPLLTPEDENDAVVNAIHALAMAINSSIILPAPKRSEPVTASALWTNALWFTSLFIALSVAFFAILAKQWLVEYNHRMADPPAAVAASLPARSDTNSSSPPTHSSVAPDGINDAPAHPFARLDALFPTASLAWARRRQFFFAAFTHWYIPVLITQVLPFLLHAALFLFLIGLSVFVWTLNSRIARGITALTGLLFGLYLIVTVLPILRADCPTATPLVRRAREVPTWIAIKAVQLWGIVLPIALSACSLSDVTSRDIDSTLDELRQRQKRIRDSGWVESGGTTDDEVKLDTLRWLILVSGSETAITTAFQSLGALPADSRLLLAVRTITAGMDSAVERLGNSQIPPTAVDIIRAVRSELILGRGSWTLPLLGLDLSPSFTQILRDSQYPDARLLSAAMHLDGIFYESRRAGGLQSFSSLYDVTDAFLRGEISSDSCQSAARLLLGFPGISVSAFACLSVLLATRSLHLDGSDKALIFRIFQPLRQERGCYANNKSHTCDGLCVVVFMVCDLDMDDPASRRIVPVILSHLLPRLMPELKSGAEELVPFFMRWKTDFSEAVSGSDWLHAPCPAGNTDVEVLSTLLAQFDWSWPNADAHLVILRWFMSRRQYEALQSPALTAKLWDTITCDARDRTWMLQDLTNIVRMIKANDEGALTMGEIVNVEDFILSLLSLCRDLLSAEIDKQSRDVLFQAGLMPEIGACLARLPPLGFLEIPGDKEFRDMAEEAVCFVTRDRDVTDKVHYLLHLSQHCVLLTPDWTRREAVCFHLDPRLLEEMLVREGPCTRCSADSTHEWPNKFLDLVRTEPPALPLRGAMRDGPCTRCREGSAHERPDEFPDLDLLRDGPTALPSPDSASTPLSSSDSPWWMSRLPRHVSFLLPEVATPDAFTAPPIGSAPSRILKLKAASEAADGGSSIVNSATHPLPPADVVTASAYSTKAADTVASFASEVPILASPFMTVQSTPDDIAHFYATDIFPTVPVASQLAALGVNSPAPEPTIRSDSALDDAFEPGAYFTETLEAETLRMFPPEIGLVAGGATSSHSANVLSSESALDVATARAAGPS